MHVGILTQWYDPEPGPASTTGVMARELVKRGHDVTVLTGFPNYPTGRIFAGYRQQLCYKEELDGIIIRRVPLYANHSNSFLKRCLNYGSFAVSAVLFGAPKFPKVDVLWVNYSPITVSLPMWAIQAIRRVPVICEVADLWPDTLKVAGLTAGRPTQVIMSLIGRWCDFIYRSSARVVYISPGAGSVLATRGVSQAKLAYVPKAANESMYYELPKASGDSKLRVELGIAEEAVVLVYAGAMGAAQGLSSMIEAVAGLDSKRLAVVLAGSGTQEQSLRLQAEQLGLRNVHFLGRIPENEMASLLGSADINFISLAEHETSGVTMPSKTQSTLACGKPIIAAADGDLRELVNRSNVGFTAQHGDADSIANAIKIALQIERDGLRVLGERARKLYEEEFSTKRLGDQTESLLRGVISGDASNEDELLSQNSLSDPSLSFVINEADLDQIVRLHKQAFPGFFMAELGDRFLREFYRGFIFDPTSIIAVVKDTKERVLGVAVGTTEPTGYFSRLLRSRFIPLALASALAVLKKPSATMRLLRAITYRGAAPTTAKGALLSSICVSPTAQGRGIGNLLLNAWVTEARANGACSAYLTTDSESNHHVKRYYASNGWVEGESFSTPEGRMMSVFEYEIALEKERRND